MLEAVWNCAARPRLRKNVASDLAGRGRFNAPPTLVGKHGQADFGGHRFALGVAGRDGHVGRLARPRRGGRVTVTVALDLHLQIGIDVQDASGLVQAIGDSSRSA